MNVSYFQLIVHADLPVMNYYSNKKEDKQAFYKASIALLTFLKSMEKKVLPYSVSFVLPPVYIELTETEGYQEEITEYLEKNKWQWEEEYSYWLRIDRKITTGLKKLISAHKIEILATTASYTSMTALSTKNGVKLQMETGLSLIEDHLHIRNGGFWLPNGAYTPGIDLHLKKSGILFSFLHHSTLALTDPLPVVEGMPVKSPHDLCLIPLREWAELGETVTEKISCLKDITKTKDTMNAIALSLTEVNELSAEIGEVFGENETLMPLSPETYIRQFSDSLEKVHISSSAFDQEKTSRLLKDGKNYAKLSFLEKEIEAWRELKLPNEAERVLKQLEKEWLMAHAVISQKDYQDTFLQGFYDAADKLSAFFKGDIDDNWLQERERKQSVFLVLPSALPKTSLPLVKKGSKKKILLLSWEYPPNIIGGLGTHVAGLAETLARQYEVHVITAQDMNKNPADESVHDSLFVYRVKPLHRREKNFLTWIGGLNLSIWEKAMELAASHSFELIQGHDWLVGAAAVSLKDELGIPLVTTMHATEHGRNGGIFTEMQRFIHEKERQLLTASDTVIICSEYMKTEVSSLFSISGSKLHVIPNGVKLDKKPLQNPAEELGLDPTKKTVFAIGRMVKEKGFETLLEAVTMLKRDDLQFVLAGAGPMFNEYKQFVSLHGLEHKVHLIGYLPEDKKNGFFQAADIVIIPSYYEPFGIVALESLLFEKPTIVSNTGGLKGIVEHGKTGMLMEPGNTGSMLEQLHSLLEDQLLAEEIGRNGRILVEKLFGWSRVGDETSRVFEETILNLRMAEKASLKE
ncbi:glycosyltransferase [Niallia taxi]|uniref:glycosyltransferase n=1 Tax=Niallia taxi TaxID=2499688 RepID=UPI00300A4185